MLLVVIIWNDAIALCVMEVLKLVVSVRITNDVFLICHAMAATW